MRDQSYMTRALRASDPRFARVLGKLGYMGRGPQPDPMDVLRVEARAAGVDVDGRWGEDRLRDEIASARAPKPKKAPSEPKARAKSTKADDGEKTASKRRYKRRDMKAED